MAAYAATVTVDVPRAEMIFRSPAVGIIIGNVNVTNYNTTGVEITDITKYFVSARVLAVFTSGPTDAGYLLVWNATDLCFDAYMANYAQTTPTDGPLIEVATDTDVGAVDFIALGLTR